MSEWSELSEFGAVVCHIVSVVVRLPSHRHTFEFFFVICAQSVSNFQPFSLYISCVFKQCSERQAFENA